MLGMEYSGLGVNTMPVDALAPKVARASARINTGCVGQIPCITFVILKKIRKKKFDYHRTGNINL